MEEIRNRSQGLLDFYQLPLPEASLLNDWNQLLKIKEHGFKERFLRKYISPILARVPASLRLLLTSQLKKIRNPSKSFPINDQTPLSIDTFIKDNIENHNPKFYLSADVDNKIGYEWLQDYISIVQKNKIALSILFVTHYDYKPDRDALAKLASESLEIGLHCYDHDIGLAYRSKNTIKRKLSQALERLPDNIVSYRSAALSLSENLLQVIAELGIALDSSASSHCIFYNSVGTTHPYPYGSPNVTELPLVLQDDHFFRDAAMSEKEAIEAFRKFSTWLHLCGSNLTINFHPHNMCKYPSFLEASCQILNEIYGIENSLCMKDAIIA